MDDEEVPASNLINLGRNIVVLKNPSIWGGKPYREAINEFVDLSNACGFYALSDAGTHLKDVVFYVDAATDAILPGSKEPLQFNAGTLDAMLKKVGQRTTIRIIDAQPLAELADLASKLGRSLEDHQEALRSDTITCLRLKLARPAIVTAWALGFDLIRSWVYNDPQRLQDFNTQLKTVSIIDYHDFFLLGDQRVLETCRDAGGALSAFTSKIFRKLHSMLDDRNNFAHANYDGATAEEAIVYVQRLVRIVTSRPFV
jgi:hypothetical protein